MRPSIRSLPCLALTLLLACPGDDGTGDDGPLPGTSTGNGTTTTTDPSTTSGSTGNAESTSTGPGEGSSSGMADSSSGGPACDPPVVGEWNACIGPDGMQDNLLCNYMGNPDGTGFLTCLTSSEIEGGNICTIRDCEDACDCFDPPATGTAEVVCSPILADGANACGLDCSAGQTCPDGMECGGGLCFWPPA